MRDDRPPSPVVRDRARRPLAVLASLASRGSNKRGRIQGFVDAIVKENTVVGWARDRREPGRRLEIQVLDGDAIVAFGLADMLRKDLVEGKVGDGKHGFRIRLPAAVLERGPLAVRVCAVGPRGKVVLRKGELALPGRPTADTPRADEPSRADEPAVAAGPAKPRGALIGALERLSGGALHGWAFNPDHPDAPALVDFYDDERYLGSVVADRSRPRLYEKGFPSGARGFVFELPASMDAGAGDRLRARVADTMYDLRRSNDFRARGDEPLAPIAAPDPAPPPVPAPPTRAAGAAAAKGEVVVGLWIVGGEHEDAGQTHAAWAAQDHASIRLIAHRPGAVPDRLAGLLVAPGGKGGVGDMARAVQFVLFARAGDRPDPCVARTLAGLPRFPDVVLWDDARPFLSADAARLELLLQPAAWRPLAVRADVLAAYPGDLAREVAAGLLSPLRLWLGGRDDLRWQRLPALPAAGEPSIEADGEARMRRWRQVLDDKDWDLASGAPVPRAAPARLSIGLWRGWDTPGLPALRQLLDGRPTAPLDILVPTEGDGERGSRRLAAAEAAIAAAGVAGARARILDCAPGAAAICAAMLAGADGDVVLLSDGGTRLAPADVGRMAAWSLHPRVGAVGLASPDASWSSGAILAADRAIRASAGVLAAPLAVDAVSFGLMAIAPQRIAAAGGPDPHRFDEVGGALEFARRLAQNGFQAVVLAGSASAATPDAGILEGPLPWDVAALLAADDLLPA